jgi:hypothetical protein
MSREFTLKYQTKNLNLVLYEYFLNITKITHYQE